MANVTTKEMIESIHTYLSGHASLTYIEEVYMGSLVEMAKANFPLITIEPDSESYTSRTIGIDNGVDIPTYRFTIECVAKYLDESISLLGDGDAKKGILEITDDVVSAIQFQRFPDHRAHPALVDDVDFNGVKSSGGFIRGSTIRISIRTQKRRS